jgi:hypothetical protein
MDLNFLVSKGSMTSADSITIKITDTGFTSSPLTLSSQIGGTMNGSLSSVRSQAFFDSSNKLFGTGGTPSANQLFTSSGPFSGSADFGVTGGTPYSLTEIITITAGAGGGAGSGDAGIVAPAPAGLVLALTGMPFLGLGVWLRRRSIGRIIA